ncbi:MAG: response regulator transcription factor [Candidatus Kapabacteria bacterium]|nr:response regulator transcription factor [Candidatus Kapabacteria bacterium]
MPKAQSISVVISDDHALVRQGLRGLIDNQSGIRVVGEAGSFAETVDALRVHAPDILIQDLNMPDLSGPLLVADLRIQFPTVKILAMTGLHRYSARSVIEAGASGFISKEVDAHETISVILECANSKFIQLYPASEPPPTKMPERYLDETGLTWRELQILRLLEYRNAEIARQLSISEGTVKNYVSSIFTKIGASSRMTALRYARERGIIP